MSEEETEVEAAAEASATEDSATKEAAPKKKGKKWPIVVGVVVVVLIAAGAGFWVWHEQPSFCNAICHTPMDPYLPTFEAEPGQPATDKYGNEVQNASAMLAPMHRVAGKTCLSCHIPVISEQVGEVTAWVSGNYTYPLEERDTTKLVEASGVKPDEFCLNESCHNMTRDDLTKATAGMGKRNPHLAQHGERACTDCHKSHRASVNACTQCHSDAPVPDGWLTVAEANKLSM